MATQAAINDVNELLPEEARAAGWTDDRIGADLDAKKTKAAILLQWWSYRASSTYHMVSISESGSSRDLGTIYSHAMEMVRYWRDLVDKEVAEAANPDLGVRGRARMHRAIRV